MKEYYTPEIEEFFVGFEYQIVNEDTGIYGKSTFKDGQSAESLVDEVYGKVRVKYLDKEDLEELGWTHIKDKKDPFYGKECYFKLNIEPGFNTGVNYLLTLYPKGSAVLEWETYSSYQNEKGRVQLQIKNKSEFIRFMSQLKIM